MNGKATRIVGAAIGAIVALLIMGLLASLWLGLKWLVNKAAGMDSETAKVWIPAFLTVAGAVIGAIVTKVLERNKDIQLKLREEKVKVYDDFLKLLFRYMAGQEQTSAAAVQSSSKNSYKHAHEQTNQPTGAAPDPRLPDLIENTRKFVLWGSDHAVKSYALFKSLGTSVDSTKPKDMMVQIGKIILAIRKDLGHSNRGLKEKDLLRLFIKDIDQIL